MMDLVKIKEKTLSLVQAVKSLVIRSEKELHSAAEILAVIKALMAEIRAGYDKNIKNAHTTWKDLITTRNEYLEPNEQAEAILKRKMATYMAAREQKRLEVAEKERKAKEEKERLEREAEQEKERKIAAAEKVEDFEKVEELIMEEPAPVPEKFVRVPEKVKVAGVRMVTTWGWEVEDLSLVPHKFFKLDGVEVNRYVQKLKGDAKIPGIRIYPKSSVASSRA